jgi:hypothetical protein
MTRLQREINARGGLERDLKIKKELLTVVKAKYHERLQFLESLYL